MIARLMTLAFVMTILVVPSAWAESNFDPFRAGSAKSSNDATARSRAGLPSTLYDLKLNDYEQDKFNACRADAKDNGKDVMEMRSASDFISAQYNDRDCNKFVVEKMLFSMELAMKNDPEALNEFQRNKDAQRKYDNLKKAYTALNHGAPATTPNTASTASLPEPVKPVRPATNNSMLMQPGSVDLFPSENTITIIQKPVIPQEWWAKDYSPVDYLRAQQRQEYLESFNNRALVPQVSGPTPLQTIMSEKQQAQFQNEGRGNHSPNIAPNQRGFPYNQ